MAQFPDEQSEDGEFARQEDAFRDWVSTDGSTAYPVESGRYHLYVSLACPWASRTVIVRHLAGLEESIRLTVLDPVRDERGWAFREGPGFTTDPINGFHFLSEAYAGSDSHFDGRVTAPVLWDKATRSIVNNSEDDIALAACGFARRQIFSRNRVNLSVVPAFPREAFSQYETAPLPDCHCRPHFLFDSGPRSRQ